MTYTLKYNDNPIVNLITGQTDKRQKRWELVNDKGEVMIVAKHKELLEQYAKQSKLEVANG